MSLSDNASNLDLLQASGSRNVLRPLANTVVSQKEVSSHISLISVLCIDSMRVSQKPWKSWKTWKITIKVPCMEKSWKLKKKLNNNGKIMEFCEI